MPCAPCEQRRLAAMEAAKAGKLAETAKHLALGAAEMLGIKAKEAVTDGSDMVKAGYVPQQEPSVVDAQNIKRY